MSEEPADSTPARLARLFREHPAWIEAASHLTIDATSTVYLSDQPDCVWHLVQQEHETRMLPGPASDPDFVFRFTPAAVERLEAATGGIDAFAVELFRSLLEEPFDSGVAMRVVASFSRLLRGGYVSLLLAAGPRVMAFGATHGIASLGALRELVAAMRSREPAEWERPT
jgi:hypothetical protein